MLNLQPNNIAEAIIQLFRHQPDFSAAELHQAIGKSFGKCSERAVYKELRKFMEQGVVLRHKGRFSLSLTWILSLLQLAEGLYGSLVGTGLKINFLPEAGQKRSWRFSDLQHLDRLWIQMIFLLFEQSKERRMYVWVPYFWFDLIHFEKDQEAQTAMRQAGNKMFMILGDDSYLSKLPQKYWDRKIYEWSYAPGPFAQQSHIYFDVIDDYILTVELTPKTTREIADLFKAVKDARQLHLISRFEQIKSRAPSRLTIEHNTKKAQRLRRQFEEYFA